MLPETEAVYIQNIEMQHLVIQVPQKLGRILKGRYKREKPEDHT